MPWRMTAEMDQALQVNWKSGINYLIAVHEWTEKYLGLWGPIQQNVF